MANDNKRAFLAASAKLKKKYGDEVVVDTKVKRAYEVISTGSAIIDYAIGIEGQSGYPLGRLVEVYGPESSGKSSICMAACASAQRTYPDKYICYIDAEQAFSLEYAKKFGIDVESDQFIFTQPSSAEEALEIMNTYAESGVFSLIVLDSVASMATEAQLSKAMDEKTMGSLAGVLSPGLTKIKNSLAKTKTLGLFVNQVREKVGSYGGGETTPGGRSLPFYASIRIRVSKTDTITDPNTKEVIGQDLKIDFKKNKVGTPYKVVATKLIFGKGFDYESEYVDIATEQGVIKKGGAWFSWLDSQGAEVSLQGKLKVANYFKDNPEEFKYIISLSQSKELVLQELSQEEILEAEKELDYSEE